MESKLHQHPLHQIAENPTHKLLLKQWLKEEDLILGRISLKESQIDNVRKEITNMYIFFFLFHSLSLIMLFSISPASPSACGRSWIPSICSFVISVVMIWVIRYKTDVESHLQKLLDREKEDGKLMNRCVDELKKKGGEFDLLSEVDALRRAKSMRVCSSINNNKVNNNGDVVEKWCSRDFVCFFFFGLACLALALTRVILCT